MATESHTQQPCIHCGECVRVCPESLNPEVLFFALVDEDRVKAQRNALNACTECNRCVEVCPSHIPLLDWFRWGKAELAVQHRAELARTRFEARNARLARERKDRAGRPGVPQPGTTPSRSPAQTINHADVLAAIARGREKYVRSSLIAAPTDVPASKPTQKP